MKRMSKWSGALIESHGQKEHTLPCWCVCLLLAWQIIVRLLSDHWKWSPSCNRPKPSVLVQAKALLPPANKLWGAPCKCLQVFHNLINSPVNCTKARFCKSHERSLSFNFNIDQCILERKLHSFGLVTLCKLDWWWRLGRMWGSREWWVLQRIYNVDSCIAFLFPGHHTNTSLVGFITPAWCMWIILT